MRRGVIDQIMIFMVVFVFLVTIFFIIIDYSAVAKVQNQLDTISRQASRLLSLGKEQSTLINMINAVKMSYYQDTTVDDLCCIETSNGSSKIIFQAFASYETRFSAFGDDGNVSMTSTSAAYNETNSSDLNCSIILQRSL